MGKKTYVTIYVDEEVVKKAKELGFNISKLCENAMKQAIKRMEGSNCQREGMETVGCHEGVGPGSGFEPEHRAPQARRLPGYLIPATFPNLDHFNFQHFIYFPFSEKR